MTTAIRTPRTNTVLDSEPLRRALRVDGWSTGVFGVVMLAGAAPLAEPLGLPTSWSIPVGVAMLGGALALLLIAGYPVVSLRYVRVVVAVNLTAAVAMVALAFSGLIDLTGLGIAFLLIGAVTVSMFAFFEYRGSVRATGKGQ